MRLFKFKRLIIDSFISDRPVGALLSVQGGLLSASMETYPMRRSPDPPPIYSLRWKVCVEPTCVVVMNYITIVIYFSKSQLSPIPRGGVRRVQCQGPPVGRRGHRSSEAAWRLCRADHEADGPDSPGSALPGPQPAVVPAAGRLQGPGSAED